MTDEPELRAKPELLNDLSGTNYGNVVQAGQVHGDVTNTVQNINNIHYPAEVPVELPRLDPWLVYAGVLAVLTAIGLFWVVGTTENRQETAGAFFAAWLVWSGWDLWNRKWQARQAARNSAQVALYVSLIPISAALGTSLLTLGLYAAAAGSAFMCLVRSPVVLQPRWVVATLAGVVACVSWYVPQLTLLWSDRGGGDVSLGILGTLLLLVVIVVPVHAVLTAPTERAVRVLRSWAFCLVVASTVTRVISGDTSSQLIGWLPLLGLVGMLVLAGQVKEKT